MILSPISRVPGLKQSVRPDIGVWFPGEFSPDQSWYVVHTKVRQERTACENLACRGFAVYLCFGQEPAVMRAEVLRGIHDFETLQMLVAH